jgi:ethanolamine ammonia-lyase small subunit
MLMRLLMGMPFDNCMHIDYTPSVFGGIGRPDGISNIRTDGLSYAAAAHKLVFLMNESRRRKLSGVRLKEEAKALE